MNDDKINLTREELLAYRRRVTREIEATVRGVDSDRLVPGRLAALSDDVEWLNDVLVRMKE